MLEPGNYLIYGNMNSEDAYLQAAQNGQSVSVGSNTAPPPDQQSAYVFEILIGDSGEGLFFYNQSYTTYINSASQDGEEKAVEEYVPYDLYVSENEDGSFYIMDSSDANALYLTMSSSNIGTLITFSAKNNDPNATGQKWRFSKTIRTDKN